MKILDEWRALLWTLLKSSGIYALATLVSPLVALILAPFLTHTLSRSEYGVLAVLTTVMVLMAGLTQLGLNHAFFRAYNCDYESPRDRLGVVSTVSALLLLVSLPVTVIVLLCAPWFSLVLFDSSAFSGVVRLAALVVLFQNLTVPGLSWLRAENRAGSYATLSIINLLVSLGAAFLLVGHFHMGLPGAILATGCGYAFIVLYTFPGVLMRAGLALRIDIIRNVLSFGLPLVSNFVSIWFLQLSDRYLLGHLGSLAQTASYAVAYTLGGVLSVVVLSPFSLAWPSVLFTIAKRDDAAQLFRLVFRWYSILLMAAAFALSLLATLLLALFFPLPYYAAAPVIPIVALSMLLFGIYDVFMVGVSIQRKTWFAVLFTSIAALINILCNLALIPLYGAIGAAASTLIAYALLACIAYIVNQRIYPIPFDIMPFLFALSVGILLFIGSSFLIVTQNIYVTWGVRIVVLCLYCCGLLLLGRFSPRSLYAASTPPSAPEGTLV